MKKILSEINGLGVFIVTYSMMIVITFGHTWHILPPATHIEINFIKALLSLISSVFWPLYWSVQAWS